MVEPKDIYEKRRFELHELFKNLLGSSNVYFQPPSNVKLKYPAIVYTRVGLEPIRADNGIHKLTAEYEVVVIDYDPDSSIVYEIAQLPLCRHTQHYEQDNLNHDAFRLYY